MEATAQTQHQNYLTDMLSKIGQKAVDPPCSKVESWDVARGGGQASATGVPWSQAVRTELYPEMGDRVS